MSPLNHDKNSPGILCGQETNLHAVDNHKEANIFTSLITAIDLYNQRDFANARAKASAHRRKANYTQLTVIKEHKSIVNSNVSIIVVGHDNSVWLNCLLGMNSHAFRDFEIIMVLNTSNRPTWVPMNCKVILLNCNTYTSEARNIGALFAKGKWLYFLDDDAICPDDTLRVITKLSQNGCFFAARGKILPISTDPLELPNHYNLGDNEIPSNLTTEGNLLILKSLFLSVGGFDPLMFAHEGEELYSRCIRFCSPSKFIYHPKLTIMHDPSQGEAMNKKIERNKIGREYQLFIRDKPVESDITILLTGDSSDKYLQNILIDASESEIARRLYLYIAAEETEQALAISRIFYGKLKITIVTKYPGRIVKALGNRSYSCICILHSAKKLNFDLILSGYEKAVKTGNIHKIIVGNKEVGNVMCTSKYPQWRRVACEDVRRLEVAVKKTIDHSNDFKFQRNSHDGLYCNRSELLFVSFYTPDKYYTTKATELKASLDNLQIKHIITEIQIPEGLAWPDVCRKKVKYLADIYEANMNWAKRIIWIDVDCNIFHLPHFLLDYNSDLMAFRRGFISSNQKDSAYTRHWEPCFLAFNVSSASRKYLSYAREIEEKRTDISATDDFFFEEAWRECCQEISSFEIPGEMSTRRAPINFLPTLSRRQGIFFKFGDSGNVDEFRGKVQQHAPQISPNSTRICILGKTKPELSKLINLCNSGDHTKILSSITNTFGEAYTESERELLKSMFSYKGTGAFIPLHWWIRPAPGNMGDWLAPYIIHKLTGLPVRYKNAEQSKLISLGSIGRYIRKQHVVWGTGMSISGTVLNPEATYLAVRGPYTAQALKESGGPTVDLFGDPGLLIAHLYKPKTIKQSKSFALVRHFVHQDAPLEIDNSIHELNILMSSPSDIEIFLDRIYESKGVITTSLHVTIICHAFRVPCRLVRIESSRSQVHGDGIKYKDYYEGVSLPNPPIPSISSKLTPKDVEALILDDLIDPRQGLYLADVLRSALRSNPRSILCEAND